MEEEARLIPPIIPTSAPLSTSFPTQTNQRHGDGFPSAMAEPARPPTSSSPPSAENLRPSTTSAHDIGPTSNVSRICRDCAFELFLHELYPWWSRERTRVLSLMEAHPLPTVLPAMPTTAPDQQVPSVNPISDAAARANIALLVASSNFAASAGELLVDDGDGAGDDDSDDEGYAGDGSAQNMDHRGDIGGGSSASTSQQRLTARLPEWVGSRPNCPDGRRCGRQKQMSHAKECACKCLLMLLTYDFVVLIMYSLRLVNHIISDTTPTVSPSVNVGVAPPGTAQLPPPVSILTTNNVAVQTLANDEREYGEAERIEQMDVDTVNQLTGLFSMFDDSMSSADTLMQDVMTVGTAAGSSDNGHPQVDPLQLPSDEATQPSGPIITPSVEVPPIVYSTAATLGGGATPPSLKQQATANEVLIDMALIRTGMGLDSPLVPVRGSSDASASSSSSSSSSTSTTSSRPTLSFSSEELSNEHSGYPGPSVEIVSNV